MPLPLKTSPLAGTYYPPKCSVGGSPHYLVPVSMWHDHEHDALEAHRILMANRDCIDHFDALKTDYDLLRARVAELEATNDRLQQERLDYSRVATTEGMNASEWIWRTGKAERRIAELEKECQRLQMAEDALCWLSMELGNPAIEDETLEMGLVKEAASRILRLEQKIEELEEP